MLYSMRHSFFIFSCRALSVFSCVFVFLFFLHVMIMSHSATTTIIHYKCPNKSCHLRLVGRATILYLFGLITLTLNHPDSLNLNAINPIIENSNALSRKWCVQCIFVFFFFCLYYIHSNSDRIHYDWLSLFPVFHVIIWHMYMPQKNREKKTIKKNFDITINGHFDFFRVLAFVFHVCFSSMVWF